MGERAVAVAVVLPLLIGILLLCPSSINGDTDPSDASVLRSMYSTLNSPVQLTKWSSSGGDPCGESWKGITCSGSRVTEIKISGLGLSGTYGLQLGSLTSLTNFDISNNNIGDWIPDPLPTSLQRLDLSACGFAGSGFIPYSINQMTSLQYLNLSRNEIQGSLNDTFGPLSALSTLDLSFNSITGGLPESLSSLSSMTNMYLENNLFTGTIDVLANLPLKNLDITNNQFNGWIPDQLKNINLQRDGNPFSSGPAPPPPSPLGTPPASRTNRNHNSGGNNNPSDGGGKKSGIGGGGVAGIVISILVVGAIVA